MEPDVLEEKAIAAFRDDLKSIEKKHGMFLMPIVNYTPHGIKPDLVVGKMQEVPPEISSQQLSV